MTTRYGTPAAALADWLAERGEPAYRARQLVAGLWARRRPLEEITELPRPLREALADAFPLALDVLTDRRDRLGATRKWLWAASDGAQVETVLMEYPDRATVCVSSQAGCAMGCTFCATGQAGFERHLDAGEIVEQVVRADHATRRRVGNVVFMGMGEPLANVGPVLASLTRLHADLGISARRITVSTVGVVPGMRRLLDAGLPVTLAVSLHAPDDALRERLVPLDRVHPIAEVLDAARDYAAASGRRVTFEYACIDGLNDHPHQADALAGRLRGMPGGAHVNLIPLNPTRAFGGGASPPARLRRFAARLEAGGATVSIRANRGVDIDAACGQLRARRASRTRPRSVTMGR